jgi:hypothetical protein
VRADVIFPNMDMDLTPVLVFGKVQKDSSRTVSFRFKNKGESKLRVDSMVLIGGDIDEFKIHKQFPFIVERNTLDTCYVTFKPGRIGSKDAKIWVYTNDLFKIGEILIWAECVPGPVFTGVENYELPTTYQLNQNYPNPFNPSTKIQYCLPENTMVNLTIYNSIGSEVETLVNTFQGPGIYLIEWHSNNLPSGIYFYKLKTSKFSALKKMLLLK